MTARSLASILSVVVATGLAAATAHAGKNASSGTVIYSANCAYCHGPKGQGDGPNAAKLSPKPPNLAASHLGAGDIATIVRDGRKSCPSWKSSLSEDDIQGVAAFTRSLQH